jgi:ribosomal protein S18 acetylase RimI-like enzyme
MVAVRRTQPQDMDALVPLMYEYIVDFYQRPKPPAEQVRALIQVGLDGKEGAQFVAEQDGQLVGFATLYFTYSTLSAKRASVMNDLYVRPEARGTGVAAELFKACHRFVQENGHAFMSWETAHDNLRAQRFYEKMGGTKGDWLTYSI